MLMSELAIIILHFFLIMIICFELKAKYQTIAVFESVHV